MDDLKSTALAKNKETEMAGASTSEIKMKRCSKCKQELPIGAFCKDRSRKDGLYPQCRECKSRGAKKSYQKESRGKDNRRQKVRRDTLKGHLRSRFNNLKQRCDNPNHIRYIDYGGRGIKNKFMSPNEFIDYVLDELGITAFEQIKGLQIHRIDNEGHYERGNIEFLTPDEHTAVHVKLRKKSEEMTVV